MSSKAIKLLIETKGAIPNSYMHALNDIKKLTNENEQLQKITKDYTQVKKLIDENEQIKKDYAQLKEAMDQLTLVGSSQ